MAHVLDIILPPTLVAVVQLSTPVFSIYCSTTLALLSFSSIPLLIMVRRQVAETASTGSLGNRKGKENKGSRWMFSFLWNRHPATGIKRKGKWISSIPNTQSNFFSSVFFFLWFSFTFPAIQTGPKIVSVGGWVVRQCIRVLFLCLIVASVWLYSGF